MSVLLIRSASILATLCLAIASSCFLSGRSGVKEAVAAATSEGRESVKLFNDLLTDDSRPSPKWLDTKNFETRCFLGDCTAKQSLVGELPILLEPSPQGAHGFHGKKPTTSTTFSKALSANIQRRIHEGWPNIGDLHDPLFIDPAGQDRMDLIAVKEMYEDLSDCMEQACCAEGLCDRSVDVLSHRSSQDNSGDSIMTEIRVRQDPRIDCTERNIRSIQQRGHAPVYPINCFHWIAKHDLGNGSTKTFTDSQYLGHGTPAAFDGSWSLQIMLGFHVMIAGRPGWTWATFWWTAEPSRKLHSLGAANDAASRAPWDRYSVAVTRLTTSNRVNPMSNPYLEGKTGEGKSNCIFCHSRARFPTDDFNGGDAAMPSTASLLPCYNAPAIFTGGSAATKQCRDQTPTHFLWSVSDHKKK